MYKQIWFRSSLDFYEFLSCLFVCHQRHYLSNIIDFSVYRWHDDTPGVEWREREWEIVQAKTEAMVARNKKNKFDTKCVRPHTLMLHCAQFYLFYYPDYLCEKKTVKFTAFAWLDAGQIMWYLLVWTRAFGTFLRVSWTVFNFSAITDIFLCVAFDRSCNRFVIQQLHRRS